MLQVLGNPGYLVDNRNWEPSESDQKS